LSVIMRICPIRHVFFIYSFICAVVMVNCPGRAGVL
jgi:hypothetical protein